MLIKYGAKNFFCFREGIEISFELDRNCPESISQGKDVANLLCVKGANGSGKTNALKIMSFIKDFCVDSFSIKPEEAIFLDPYFSNTDPIYVFCEMEIDGVRYRYEISLTQQKIISEILWRKKKRFIEVFRREGSKLKSCIQEFDDLKSIKLRSNASIISTAYQHESKSTFPIYNFFSLISSNVHRFGRGDLITDYNVVSELYNDLQYMFEFTKNIIQKCDLGIKNIELHSREDEKGKKIYYPIFEHETNVQNNMLTFHSQSSGTRTLFLTLLYYKMVLDSGGVLVMDEFDINFHPDILPVLLDLFENEEQNPKNAQMIFTTHNPDIMDRMGKYRSFLLNKEESESYGYRLDEIPGDILRNGRPISPVYKSGKIGGVPRI